MYREPWLTFVQQVRTVKPFYIVRAGASIPRARTESVLHAKCSQRHQHGKKMQHACKAAFWMHDNQHRQDYVIMNKNCVHMSSLPLDFGLAGGTSTCALCSFSLLWTLWVSVCLLWCPMYKWLCKKPLNNQRKNTCKHICCLPCNFSLTCHRFFPTGGC